MSPSRSPSPCLERVGQSPVASLCGGSGGEQGASPSYFSPSERSRSPFPISFKGPYPTFADDSPLVSPKEAACEGAASATATTAAAFSFGAPAASADAKRGREAGFSGAAGRGNPDIKQQQLTAEAQKLKLLERALEQRAQKANDEMESDDDMRTCSECKAVYNNSTSTSTTCLDCAEKGKRKQGSKTPPAAFVAETPEPIEKEKKRKHSSFEAFFQEFY